MEYTNLEIEVIKLLLNINNEKFNILKEQFLHSKVKTRDITQVWFFTNISIGDSIKSLPQPIDERIVLSDVWARINWKDDIGFFLFIEKGYISMLEWFTYWDTLYNPNFKEYKVFYEWDNRDIPNELLD